MKRITGIVILAVLCATGAMAQTAFKKYDIKSGIVTYDQTMTVGSMVMKKTVVIFFDDYGMKECRDTYSGKSLEESYFSDGKDLYSVRPAKKTAHKQGPAFRGVGIRVDWTDFGTDKDRQSGKIRFKPSMMIAGKNCDVFETGDEKKGDITTYGGWKKILMLLHSKSSMTEMLQRAVKIEEVAVPEEKFKVPPGYIIEG